MKKNLLSGIVTMLSASLMVACASPKDDVINASTTLGNQTNYAWQATVEVPADAQFKPGPTDGKTEKGGYTTLSFNFGDNTTEAVTRGTNGVIKTEDGWKTLTEAMKDDGSGGFNPAAFIARIVQKYKTPAAEAASLADAAKELKQDADSISGDLTDAGAKAQLSFGRATITDPKGSVKFWVKDGKLVKYQFHLLGTADFNGNSFDIDRTTTVVIRDVNATKIDVADDVKKKLE